MVSIVRKHVVSDHGSYTASNGKYLECFVIIICVILLRLCVSDVKNNLILTQNQVNCTLNIMEELGVLFGII